MTSSRSFLLLAAVALGGCATTTPRLSEEALAAVLPASPSPPPPPPVTPARLLPPTYLSTALTIISAVRQGDDSKLRSIIALNPNLVEQARALQEARLPDARPSFAVLVKDNIETRDQPTTAGSLALAGNNTGRDAPIVARLRSAGALILGKTNLSEWANIRSSNSISGWSAVGGQTRNPYALDRNTCGSSSGSGAAVAARLRRQ